jgi:hypothetical protein
MPAIEERLDRIESILLSLVEQQVVREWYSTDQFAKKVGLAEVTVRGHCRSGRLDAEKQKSGRGAYHAWALSRRELLRYQREGLLPPGWTRAPRSRDLIILSTVSESDAR